MVKDAQDDFPPEEEDLVPHLDDQIVEGAEEVSPNETWLLEPTKEVEGGTGQM